MHEDVFAARADKAMRDPKEAQGMLWMRRAIKEGRWKVDGLQDGLAQPFGGWTPGQTLAMSYLVGYVASGRVARCRVEVGQKPSADADRVLNAFALDQAADPFTAELDVEQNNGDADGSVSWSEPITLNRGFGGDLVTVDPLRDAPLEVGYTCASRTWLHLFEGGSVAHWPYGQTWLWVFVGMPTPTEFVLELRKPLNDFYYALAGAAPSETHGV
jgi:hypothetical protein